MSNRTKVLVALVLGVAFIAAVTLAYAATKAPEKGFTIYSTDVFKEPKQGPVIFPHDKHKELKCTECHHVLKDGKNVWKQGDEVQKCSACHKLKAEGKTVKLEKAFHERCQTCHKKLKKEKKKTGPTSCTKCHQKKKK